MDGFQQLTGTSLIRPLPEGGLLNLYIFRGLVLLVLVLVVKIASGETVCDDDSSLLIFVVCGQVLHHTES